MAEMTRDERRALTSIVKGRFKLLREQIEIREQDIRNQGFEQAMASKAKAIEKHNKKMAQLRDKLKKLQVEYQEAADAAYDDGIMYPRYRGEDGRPNIKIEQPFSISSARPIDLDELLNRQRRELSLAAHKASSEMNRTELDLLERIMLDSIDGDAAKNFLSELPTVDKYLPLPNGAKPSYALESSGQREGA